MAGVGGARSLIQRERDRRRERPLDSNGPAIATGTGMGRACPPTTRVNFLPLILPCPFVDVFGFFVAFGVG